MFDWDAFFTEYKAKLERAEEGCTVGRYVTPKEDNFPYVDVAIGDNRGSAYDLRGYENATNPLVVIQVYDTGSLAYSNCVRISETAKKLLLSYGFHCLNGPMEIANADQTIVRWTGRYQRVVGAGEEVKQVNFSDLQ